MSDYATENNFVIAEGTRGELYFLVSPKKDEPKRPYIVYDGFDHAVFIRNDEQKIILDYINPEVRDKLRKSKEVYVIESIHDNIRDIEPVRMQQVEKMPVDWSKIGLKTWEEAALAN